MNGEDLSPALRGKTQPEQLRLIRAMIGAGRRGVFPLGQSDSKLLAQFVMQVQNRRVVDDALLLAVSGMVRHYEQHLIAIARSVR